MRNVDHITQERARELRRFSTVAELRLWAFLRNRELGGLKFTRQVPIGPYIADFVCRSLKLVIEVDGPTHEGREVYDAARTRFLVGQDYRVLRFGNEDVLGNLKVVLEEILKEAKG